MRYLLFDNTLLDSVQNIVMMSKYQKLAPIFKQGLNELNNTLDFSSACQPVSIDEVRVFVIQRAKGGILHQVSVFATVLIDEFVEIGLDSSCTIEVLSLAPDLVLPALNLFKHVMNLFNLVAICADADTLSSFRGQLGENINLETTNHD
jgi:hypothetical protein